MKTQMNDVPRRKLCELVQRSGSSLCRDAVRCEGLLRDLCPGYPREIAVLMAALRQQVGMDLLTLPQGVTVESHLQKLSRRLYENLGICGPFAWWAVETWALALGVLSRENEVKPPRDREHQKTLPPTGGRMTPPRTRSLIVAADGSGDTPTIGKALERAPPHTQIFIRPGRYRESLTLTSPVQLIGEGRPSEVIIQGFEGGCLTLSAPSCLVHGLTLEQNALPQEQPGAALNITRGEGVVEDCIIHTAAAGIAIRGGRADPFIRRCTLSGSGGWGIIIEKGGGQMERCRIEGLVRGISIRGKSGAVFRDCTITHGHIGIDVAERGCAVFERCEIADHSYAGLTIQGGSQPVLHGCTFSQAQFGVEVTDRGKGALEQCTIRKCAQGVYISERGDPILLACTIQHNQFGIRVTAAGKGRIQNSDISENEFAGISIKEGGNPRVSGCRIHRNGDVGIWIQKSGLGVLEGNDLRGNRKGGLSLEEGSRVQQLKNLV